jgi:Flp pilus assembly protein TadD
MSKSNRLGTALTAVSLIAVAAGCAGPGNRIGSASMFGGKVNSGELPLATKAQLALASNDVGAAIPLAELAVERSPQDAGFRTLLGNCYLAAGRFASAEAAYRDALSIYANQPQVILKLALVQIAQGKNDEAKLLLAEARGVLDASDAGLALALAGDAQAAVAMLEPAARTVGADARTRQNLALAYAFSGDWAQARIVAAQDVPADQVDTRIQQWMVLAKPARASDQVAAFIGIQPAATDPGQPVRLALHKGEAVQQAAAEPIGDVPAGLTETATVELPAAVPAAAAPAVVETAEVVPPPPSPPAYVTP